MTNEIMKMNESDQKRNLIVGIMVSLGWYDIEPFMLSWKKNCSPSELLVCVFDEISDWTIDCINRCATDDLTVTIKKVPDELKGKYFGYIRFKMIEDHLIEHRGEYDQVFVTDMRNVIIQDDPFEEYADYDSYLSYQTGRKKIDEPTVLRWLVPILGGETARQFKNFKTVKSGTLMGTADAVEITLHAVNEYIMQDEFDIPAADRAWLNYLIFFGNLPIENIIESDCETGVICTLDSPPISGDVMLSLGGRIVPAVVRHYDRTLEGRAFATRLYRSEDVFDYENYDDLSSKLDVLNVMLRRKRVIDYLRYIEDFCECVLPLSEWRNQYWRGVKLIQAFNPDWSESFEGLIAAQFLCRILTKMFGEIPPVTDIKALKTMHSITTSIKEWQAVCNEQFNDVVANGMSLGAERAEKRAQIQTLSDLNGKLEELGHSHFNRNARSVVDGFNEYLEHIVDIKKVDVHEMKNFMEPIFKKAGYRQTGSDDDDCVKNILILFEKIQLRDLIVASASIRETRRLYPNAYITLVVDQDTEELVECCPYVNEIVVHEFVLDGDRAPYVVPDNLENVIKKYNLNLEVAQKLLPRFYDVAFAFVYGSYPSTPLLAYMSGAKRIISHHNGIWRPFVTDFVVPKNNSFHLIDESLVCIEHLADETVSDRRLEMWFDQDDLDQVVPLVPKAEKLYSIGLDALVLNSTRYPALSYAALISLILKADKGAGFILVGSSAELENANLIMNNVNPYNIELDRVVNLTGRLKARSMAAALSLCDVHIGNFGDIVQVAAAVHKPTLLAYCFPLEFKRTIREVLFWYPSGVPSVIVCPSHALSECKNSRTLRGCAAREPHCITQIKPQDMFNALQVLLEKVAAGDNTYAVYDPEKGVLM